MKVTWDGNEDGKALYYELSGTEPWVVKILLKGDPGAERAVAARGARAHVPRDEPRELAAARVRLGGSGEGAVTLVLARDGRWADGTALGFRSRSVRLETADGMDAPKSIYVQSRTQARVRDVLLGLGVVALAHGTLAYSRVAWLAALPGAFLTAAGFVVRFSGGFRRWGVSAALRSLRWVALAVVLLAGAAFVVPALWMQRVVNRADAPLELPWGEQVPSDEVRTALAPSGHDWADAVRQWLADPLHCVAGDIPHGIAVPPAQRCRSECWDDLGWLLVGVPCVLFDAQDHWTVAREHVAPPTAQACEPGGDPQQCRLRLGADAPARSLTAAYVTGAWGERGLARGPAPWCAGAATAPLGSYEVDIPRWLAAHDAAVPEPLRLCVRWPEGVAGAEAGGRLAVTWTAAEPSGDGVRGWRLPAQDLPDGAGATVVLLPQDAERGATLTVGTASYLCAGPGACRELAPALAVAPARAWALRSGPAVFAPPAGSAVGYACRVVACDPADGAAPQPPPLALDVEVDEGGGLPTLSLLSGELPRVVTLRTKDAALGRLSCTPRPNQPLPRELAIVPVLEVGGARPERVESGHGTWEGAGAETAETMAYGYAPPICEPPATGAAAGDAPDRYRLAFPRAAALPASIRLISAGPDVTVVLAAGGTDRARLRADRAPQGAAPAPFELVSLEGEKGRQLAYEAAEGPVRRFTWEAVGEPGVAFAFLPPDPSVRLRVRWNGKDDRYVKFGPPRLDDCPGACVWLDGTPNPRRCGKRCPAGYERALDGGKTQGCDTCRKD